MLDMLALAIVLLIAAYFVGLGVLALLRPKTVEVFLRRFAGSPLEHFSELAIRVIVGSAFVVWSPYMLTPMVFEAFGWVLIATSGALLVLPWKLHSRFAQWSVPLATRNMKLFGVGSLSGGVFLVCSLLLGAGYQR